MRTVHRTRRQTNRIGWCLAVVGMAWAAAARDSHLDLEQGFHSPPATARPHTWWHWMNGNITAESLTADLEAMARVGVGGAQIFNVDCGIPHGPIQCLSPQWLQLFRHALNEADRLGLEICVHNCPGWSSSGGPWVRPEHAMQRLTWSEVRIVGGQTFRGVLPQPPTTWDAYRDIAVLAFPVPDAERFTMADLKPDATTSIPKANARRLLDGNVQTAVDLPLDQSPTAPPTVTLTFPQPFPARTLQLFLGTGRNASRGTLYASADGEHFRKVADFSIPSRSARDVPVAIAIPLTTARVYRIEFKGSGQPRDGNRISLAEVSLSAGVRLEGWREKAGFVRGGPGAPTLAPTPEGVAIPLDAILDLSDCMRPDGAIEWTAPAGADWCIVRFGHTPTGKNNHPGPPEGTGPEVDKLSREAADAFWQGGVVPLLQAAGPMVGRSWKHILIDSYEVGSQNWTPRFREEFQRRRGYDLLRWLPAMTGRVVDSIEASERFLWDVRRTIADLFHENYFGYFAELAHRHGLWLSIEPYGNGLFDDLAAGSYADIPMGEFWVHSADSDSVRLAASIAHVYGRRFVGAESFTARWEDGRWQVVPSAIKALGDRMWCSGVNRFIFHRYAHQPWTNRVPGMTMGPWGFHFERTTTWWEPGAAWLRYIARCQWMLQEGTHVADVLVWPGDRVPTGQQSPRGLPDGYAWDGCDAATLLQRLEVREGDLVAPHGSRWRLLVLCPSDAMTVASAERIVELVRKGARVIGPAPKFSPSLRERGGGDQRIRELATEWWSSGPIRVGEKKVWDVPVAEALTAFEIEPDVQVLGAPAMEAPRIAWIHRRAGPADVYFISNQSGEWVNLQVSLRATGRQPELWDPLTGRCMPAPIWTPAGTRTVVTLHLDPLGSVFVVFRKPFAAAAVPTEVSFNGRPLEVAAAEARPQLTILRALYTDPDDRTRSIDLTRALNERIRDHRLSVVVNNSIAGDPAPLTPKILDVEYVVGSTTGRLTVHENAILRLPPVPEAKLRQWMPPVTVEGTQSGRCRVTAWQPGRVTVKFSERGRSEEWVASEGIRVQPVEGRWTVRFQPGRGAPESIQMDRLISWTEHADPGVRYFSGTASYVIRFRLERAPDPAQQRAWLNLGDVRFFAEPILNGRSLGVLWVAPFRVDVTDVLREGENELEIRITNTWVNRLIGDEFLPEDRDWTVHGPIKSWPQWVLEGRPSPSGRITFTTWHHWTKEDPLVPSGLLGPVVIQYGAVHEF